MKQGLRAPDRGEIVWLHFTPQAGHEQAGRRPALTLSPRSYNKAAGLALFCPITSVSKGYPFEVSLPRQLCVEGVVLADQIKSLDWRARRAQKACRVPKDVTCDVIARALALLMDE